MKRMRSPWLWSNIVFNFSNDGKLHRNCLKVLHGFTKTVRTKIE
jgi:hypothetical protein